MATTTISVGGVGAPRQKCGKGDMKAFLAKANMEGTPLRNRNFDTASTACESFVSELSSSASTIMTSECTSGISATNDGTIDWMVDVANAHSLDSVKSPIEVVVEEGAETDDTPVVRPPGLEYDPKLRKVTVKKVPAKKAILCQQHKSKGEAQPGLYGRKIKHHKEREYTEENHFGLCDHYAKLLEKALEDGFHSIHWHCGFTLHHLAAKRNNMELLQYLLSQEVESVHAIDEFGKKPVDYSCSKKRDTVFFMLENIMQHVPAPKNELEQEYQDIKAGIHKEKKEKKKSGSGANNIAETANMENIAEGQVSLKRPDDLLTVYEAEKMTPPEYQKILKTLVNGGSWENVQWPKGTSLLHWAARNGKDELCRFLVFEFQVDTRTEDSCGRSPIYYAKLKKHRKLAKKLISSFGFW